MSVRKLLVLDGIGGVPLGREVRATCATLGVEAAYVDCLRVPRRRLYGLRAAYAKARNKRDDRDGFHFLPRLVPDNLRQLIARERPSHILVVGFIYKFHDPRLLRQTADECGARLRLYDTDSCNLYGRRQLQSLRTPARVHLLRRAGAAGLSPHLLVLRGDDALLPPRRADDLLADRCP